MIAVELLTMYAGAMKATKPKKDGPEIGDGEHTPDPIALMSLGISMAPTQPQ